MTNHETRALHAVLTVTVETRADGIYYVDQADLARHVKGWLEDALCDRDDIEEVSVADAVLPVLLAPVDQAAVLREAADDLATAFGDPMAKHIGILGASHLRRRAREIEAGQTGEDQPETPLEKRLRYSERRNDELRAECKRRGKRVLEQSEKIIALEREIDEVRRQLGAEILRAGQAEAELRRLADEAQQPDDGEGDELVCVDECGFCDACGFEPFGTPAEGWREAARFLRRTARDSGDRRGVLHGARLIEAELRRLADESGPCVAGEQQNETPEAAPGCAHCGKTIRLITGTLAEWWVHEPGGNTICVPEQAASSPRATPKPTTGACPHNRTWPDRSVCLPPCGAMHDRCVDCETAVDDCPNDAAGVRQDGAQPCAECGHPKDAHREGDDPVTPGTCGVCDAVDPDEAHHDFARATP